MASRKKRRKCGFCQKRYGRRSFPQGDRFCSTHCADAFAVRRHYAAVKYVVSVGGGKLTKAQAKKFMDILKNQSVLSHQAIMHPLQLEDLKADDVCPDVAPDPRIRFGTRVLRSAGLSTDVPVRSTNAEILRRAKVTLGDLAGAQTEDP